MRVANPLLVAILFIGLSFIALSAAEPAAGDEDSALELSIQLWKFAEIDVEVTLDGKVVYDDRDPKVDKVTTTGRQTGSGPVHSLKRIAVAMTKPGVGHMIGVRLIDKKHVSRLEWKASESAPWVVILCHETKKESIIYFKLQLGAAAKK